MREAVARGRFVRVSPLKCRAVADEIRGKHVEEAQRILAYSSKKAARIVSKILDSAVANAEQNYEMDADRLWIRQVWVDEGPRMRRLKPRAFGRADIMRRKLSHITIAVAERED
ncbi:MAG: 50S ribosomal protein L22 [Candidatus Bipolaricaulota bacterium]